jgi:hypothetical protein
LLVRIRLLTIGKAENILMLFQPLAGWREVKVTERRTKPDFAYIMRDAKATVRWQFDVQQARTKLGRFYPQLS